MNRSALALSFLMLLTGLRAQAPEAEDAPKQAPFVFEAGTVRLTELVEKCGRYLKWNLLIDENEFVMAANGGRRARKPAKGEEEQPLGPVVTLNLPVVTDQHGCEEMLGGFLWRHGFAVVPLDEQKDVYEIIHRSGQRAREISMRSRQRSVEQILARPDLRYYVTTVYEMKHGNAQLANNALRPFFAGNNNGQGVQIGNLGNRAAILISGPQNMVANAIRLLQIGDKPSKHDTPSVEQRLDALQKANEQLRRELDALKQHVAGKQ